MYDIRTWLREPWIPPIQGLERGSTLTGPSAAYVAGQNPRRWIAQIPRCGERWIKKDSLSAGPFLLPVVRPGEG